MVKLGFLYETPISINLSNSSNIVCYKGLKLEICNDCFDESYLYELTNHWREGLKEKKLVKGDIVEVQGCWRNLFGIYIKCKFGDDIFDIKPENLKPVGKINWIFRILTNQIADTGDYDSSIEFTNGKDILCASGDNITNEQCKQLCELLDLVPDLWSMKHDSTKFELSMAERKIKFYEDQLNKIAKSNRLDKKFDKDEEIEDLRSIASNALYEAKNGLF